MTNFEKYTDELCKILSHYVGVSDDKPRICNDLSCKNCDFDDYGLDCIQEVEDWLKKEVTKRPMVEVPDMNVGKCSEIPNNSDCVSRRAAIDALNKLDVSDGVGISSVACDLQEEAIRSIENLPSAQPEIIRCKECVYADENYHCDYMTTWNDGDCFCCYGKRRTDGRFDKQTGGD